MRLEEIGEFGLIERIRQFVGEASTQVSLGIGDDGAIWQPAEGKDLVFSCDTQVEGRHFLPFDQHPWQDATSVGRRCVQVNVSDLAAMAAKPRFALVSLGLPKHCNVDDIEMMYRAIVDACQPCQLDIIGGNITSTSGPMFIDMTVAGEVERGQARLRGGAKVGDRIGVTGFPGTSAAALSCLLWQCETEQYDERWRALCRHYLAPTARWELGIRLGTLAHALIDISDGFFSDLGHVLGASGVGANLFRHSLPYASELLDYCQMRGIEPDSFLMGASDDYELLLTATPDASEEISRLCEEDGLALHWIGELTEERGIRLFDEEGEGELIEPRGWKHF